MLINSVVKGDSVMIRIPREYGFVVSSSLNSSKVELDYDPFGEKTSDNYLSKLGKYFKSNKKKIEIVTVYTVLILISLAVSLACGKMNWAFCVCIWDIALRKKVIANYILLVIEANKNPDLKKMKGLFAAIQMGEASYNALKRAPSLKEIKKFTMFDEEYTLTGGGGGTNFFIYMFMYIFLIFFPIEIVWRNVNLWVKESSLFTYVAGTCAIFVLVVLLFIFIAEWLEEVLGKYLEIYFLKIPTEKELKTVINALKVIEKIEKNYKEFSASTFDVINDSLQLKKNLEKWTEIS